MIQSTYSAISLLVVNLIPLYGVFFWDWNVFSLLLLYWSESVIIGVFTVLKMSKAEGGTVSNFVKNMAVNGRPIATFGAESAAEKRKFFIPFFSLHFGIFTLMHGIFVMVFFFSKDANWLGILFSFLSLCVSHLISYQANFIGLLEYKRVSVESLFAAPYPRVIVMHLTVILGGFFAFTSKTVYALALLVVLKTIADLGSHLYEHRKIYIKHQSHKIGELTYQSKNFKE